MPIVVRHDDPNLGSAMAILLAQAEARERAAQQQAQQMDALTRLAGPRAPQPVDPAAPAGPGARGFAGGSMLPNVLSAWGGGGSAARGGARGYGGYGTLKDPEELAAGLLGKLYDNQGDVERANVQGQYDLAEAQMGMQEAQMGDEAAAQLAEQQAMARLNQELATSQIPDWMQIGLDNGKLRYSEDQLTDMAKLQRSISNAWTDPTLSPNQRAAFIAQQQQKLSQIEHHPEKTPFNQIPKTPQQVAKELTWVEKDPATGLDVEYQIEERNGVRKKVPTAAGQVRLDAWKEQEKIKAQRELEVLKKANGVAGSNAKYGADRYDKAVKSLMERHKYDREPYSPTQQEIMAEMALRDEIERTGQMPTGEVGPLPMTPTPSAESVSPLPRSTEPIFNPVDYGLNPISSPEDIQSLIAAGYIGLGDTVQTPQGPRVVTPEVMQKLGFQ